MPTQELTPGAYNYILVRPLSGALGAEIHCVDLSSAITDDVFAKIHRAFLDYLIIFFRKQVLDPTDLNTFAARFGGLDIHSILQPTKGQPEVLPVFTEPENRHVYAEGWHADVTYQKEPTLGTVLCALDAPDIGGDTLFANQYLAYQAFSSAMRAMLDELSAIHSTAPIYGTRNHKKILKAVDHNVRGEQNEHPVVRTHPQTTRGALFVNEHFTIGFKDIPNRRANLCSSTYSHMPSNPSSRPDSGGERVRWRCGTAAAFCIVRSLTTTANVVTCIVYQSVAIDPGTCETLP